MRNATFVCPLEFKVGNPIVDKVLSPHAARLTYKNHSGGQCVVAIEWIPDRIWDEVMSKFGSQLTHIMPGERDEAPAPAPQPVARQPRPVAPQPVARQPRPTPEPEVHAYALEDLQEMTVAELKELAQKIGVDLTGVKRKADIVDHIVESG